MGRAPCCDKANVKKGPWSPEEDTKLENYIYKFGTGGNWIALPHKAGLKRCGKSCRLRWLNYLRPNLKHGEFSHEEDTLILNLFANIGSRWSIIASQLPGRTDNDIKNYWNTKLKKKLMSMMMIPPQFHQPHFPSSSFTYNNNYQTPSPLLFSSSPQICRDDFYTIDPTKPLTSGLDFLSPNSNHQTTASELMFQNQEGSSVIPLLIQGNSSSSSRKLGHHQTLNVFSDTIIKQEIIMSSADIDYYQISNEFEQSQTLPNNWQESALLAYDHLEDVKRLIAGSNSASLENYSNFLCPVIDEQSRLQDKSMYYYGYFGDCMEFN